MTKAELIERIAKKTPKVARRDVESIVNAVFHAMSEAIKRAERIEIRGFGTFGFKVREARAARNPKTGARVLVPTRRTLSFTVGKDFRRRLNPTQGVEPNAPPARALASEEG